jgi:hypothetical protein
MYLILVLNGIAEIANCFKHVFLLVLFYLLMLGFLLDIKVFGCMVGYIVQFDGSIGLTLLLSGEREVLDYFLLYNHLSLPYDWLGHKCLVQILSYVTNRLGGGVNVPIQCC